MAISNGTVFRSIVILLGVVLTAIGLGLGIGALGVHLAHRDGAVALLMSLVGLPFAGFGAYIL